MNGEMHVENAEAGVTLSVIENAVAIDPRSLKWIEAVWLGEEVPAIDRNQAARLAEDADVVTSVMAECGAICHLSAVILTEKLLDAVEAMPQHRSLRNWLRERVIR